MSDPRLHEPNEIADRRSKLEAAQRNAREQRDALLHFGQDWQRRAEAAEGRIELAREAGQGFVDDPREEPAVKLAARVMLARLQPANAEGIASEGGSAQAANPRELPTDAPSAEAGCDHAKHLPSIVRSQEGETATCRCGLSVVAVHEESEGAWWEPVDAPSAPGGRPPRASASLKVSTWG